MKASRALKMPIIQAVRSFRGFGSRRPSESLTKYHLLLPFEIIAVIVEFLQQSPADLYNLTLCSRTFHQITFPFLYQHITLASKRSAECFFTTIALYPELRQGIRTFRTAWDDIHDPSLAGNTLFTPEPKADAETLPPRTTRYPKKKKEKGVPVDVSTKQLEFLNNPPPNLKSLAIGLSPYDYATIVPVLTRLSLSKLSLTVGSLDANGLVAILQSQPLLKHLELPRVYAILPLLPTDLLLLETFVGERHVALRIVPGRPIKTLSLLSTISSPERILPYLTPHPGDPSPIEELSLQAKRYLPSENPRRAGVMAVIANSFPKLRILKMSLTFVGNVEVLPIEFKNFFQLLPRHISRMKNLERLNFAETSVIVQRTFTSDILTEEVSIAESFDLSDDSVAQHLLHMWCMSCRTLNQVIMPNSDWWRCSKDGVWRKYGQYVLQPDECTVFDVL